MWWLIIKSVVFVVVMMTAMTLDFIYRSAQALPLFYGGFFFNVARSPSTLTAIDMNILLANK